ncbi:MAG: DUF6320 domain-containing protein [Clostridiaceae bacterium]|nr:DUF6320 domain-containing protein [Clostridiaceae bacterium]
MNQCKRCGVEIVDDTAVCPLCETILTTDGDGQTDTYPDVRSQTKIFRLLLKLFVFVLVVLEMIFLVADYYSDDRFSWSLITGVCFLYAIFTIYYSFNRRNSHIRKMYWQTLAGMFFLLLLDRVTGSSGWSVVYAMPCAVLFLDAVLAVCMLFNRRDWQSYLLVQLFVLLVSAILLALFLFGVTAKPALPWTAFLVSAILFSLCFCIGNRTAKNELKKRFYI